MKMNNYSKTIKLPFTNLSMKANLAQKEQDWLSFWEENKIYSLIKKERSSDKKFILHDGPPYANGDLHMGHALNKILKDIVCRYKFQSSHDVHYVPGWDCHGLPIEWKIEEKFRKKGKNKGEISLNEFRNECRNFASQWVIKQKEQFSRLGIQNDWNNIYTTMTREAETTIVKELLKFLESGELYLGFKPVMWSVVEKTALAEAEVEYKEKVSKSIYVKFPIKNLSTNASIVIWTTTPWTIPCNRAISYSNTLNYKKIKILDNYAEINLKKKETIFIAETLLSNFISIHKIEKFDIEDVEDVNLFNTFLCDHPLKNLGFTSPIRLFPSTHVTDDNGTGFVHIAPNHGEEDFRVGKVNGLKNSDTVEANGIYSSCIPFFKNIHVFKADEQIIEKLLGASNLLSSCSYNHSYPHSWRSKAPLIFRATSQWFISMDKNNLRSIASREIESVRWIPSSSINRIKSMVKERPDWCISRQRSWGVPITVFVNKKSKLPLVDELVNKKIVDRIEEYGIDCWFNKSNDFFLTDKYESDDFEKVDSILDVWFDSGSSHVFVLKNNGFNDKADLYLEGTDQHRGWFQSSLLQSCAIYGNSPYKAVLTHGFVIDDKGRKMSKSLGNVILPSEIINKYGADILRLWVASSNFNEDLKISFENLERLSESYRKIRNTLRFILGNLNNWEKKEYVNEKELPPLERFIRYKLYTTNTQVIKHFEEYNFHKAFQVILNFCSQTLSAFFFDIRKDCLYCDSVSSTKRRSCRTVLFDILGCIITWLSPILPFTTEEVWQNWRKDIDNDAVLSCHLLKFISPSTSWRDENIEKEWKIIFELRELFLVLMEKNRKVYDFKSSLDAEVDIYIKDIKCFKILEKIELSEILIVSKVNLIFKNGNNSNEKNIEIIIKKIEGTKCPRCWKKFHMQKEQKICFRCQEVINANN